MIKQPIFNANRDDTRQVSPNGKSSATGTRSKTSSVNTQKKTHKTDWTVYEKNFV